MFETPSESQDEVSKPNVENQLEIPCLQAETLDTLEKKVPSFFAYLLGEQVIPKSVDPEVKKTRGRPRKYLPQRQSRTVHKIEHDPSLHKVIPDRIRSAVREMRKRSILPTVEAISSTARHFGLTYQQVFDLTRDL